MPELGSLWYTVGLKDMTDATIKKINDKLKELGSDLVLNPKLAKSIDEILPKGITVTVTPDKVSQEALDKAIEGKVMRAEVLPVVEKLKTAVTDALKGVPVSFDNISIPPEKLTAAIAQALTSANFTSIGESVGDALGKAIAVKVAGQTYTANISANTDALKKAVEDTLSKIEQKERKVKLDKSAIKEFKGELTKALTDQIKVTPTLNLTQDALQKAAEGKVMKVEIMPLLTHLRRALLDATTQTPIQAEVGVNSTKLRNLVTSVLTAQGYMVHISTVSGLEKSILTQLNGRTYNVKIRANATEIAQSVQASLMQVQSRYFGLQVSKDILRNSIDAALMGKPFTIQIAVMQDQARRAVQNALNNARMVGKDDALAYQRLQTGELRAAQAELARLKAAHMGAADAARAHASASISLGGAMGSNIKIAGELGSAMASLYSIHAAKEFLSQVIEIGGELEHQKIAMDTIFGDKGKTSELFGQIKGLARQSPFGVMELTKSVKALSAYGVEYNEIYDTAKRLADISAATSVDINRLILAFGKTKSRGFLDGLEAKQFAYANIPIYEMVRKKLEELEGQAITTAEVMGRIKKREIGFDIVKDVLWDMTDEGGKFYNMQEALAGSVKTSWKLVRDNIELMFGEIADSGVGDALKSVAEILQSLTRNWKAMGTMIGAAAVAFGVYKVAVAASNAMMGQSNVATLKSVTASNLAETAKLSEAATYRKLTAAEQEQFVLKSALSKLNRSLLLSHKALTTAEWEAAFVNGKVTQEYILRRIALGKLTKAEIDFMITSGMVDAKLINTAVAASKAKVSLASLWAMVKAGSASVWASAGIALGSFSTKLKTFSASLKTFKFESLFTWVKTLPSRMAHAEVGIVRLKLALSGLGRAMSSIGAFLFNPATITMAAIGGLMYAWERNNEEMQKAKEIGEGLFTKATEGADNLSKTLADIKPSAGLSNHELLQGIEQMEQAIKDYSPTPIKDINDALYTQEGLLRPIADRYDELKKKVEELKSAFESIESGNISNAVENAINDTNTGWFGGVFNDDINTNVKDYATSLKKQSDSIRRFLMDNAKAAREAVKEAMGISSKFAASVKDMNTQQAFMELVKNWDSYKNEFEKNSKVAITVGVADDDNSVKIKENLSTLLDDMQAFWDSIRTDAKLNGIDAIEDATEEVKKGYAISIKNWIQGLEVPDEVKQMMFNYYSNLLNFDFETFNATEQIADSLNQGLEAEVGTAIFQKVKNGIALSDDEQRKVNEAFEKIYHKLFEKLPEAQKAAFNKAVASAGDDGILRFDSGKMMRILASLNVRTNWKEWQREIDDATGNLKPIQTWVKGASDIPSFIKAAQEGYKEAKTTIDKLKPLMLKAGFEFEFGELLPQGTPSTWYMGLSDVEKQMVDQYNSQVKILKAAQKAGKVYGFDPAEEYNKKNKSKKGSEKDEFAEAVKERISLLKKAKSEYESLAKSIGREAASKELADSPIFAGLKANNFLPEQAIPRTLDEYEKALDELQEKLTAKGLKSKKHRELNVEIEQVKFDIKKARVDEQLKLALDKVSKEAERQLADWNLFDKIRKATGNQDLAMSIAFGMNATAETDYPAMIKQQFAKVATQYKNLKELTYDMIPDASYLADAPDEVKKAWEDTTKKLQQYAREQKDAIADILSEYQSLQDKLAKIDADRDRKIETVNKSDMSAPDKAKYIQRINVEADYQKFTQSNEYLQFFAGIYALTNAEATNIGDLIEQNLNKRLQAGTISAEDYYKEIERVRQQLDKLRNVKSTAMTFLTKGTSGVNEKKQNANDAARLKTIQKIAELEETLAAQKAAIKGIDDADGHNAVIQTEQQLAAAKEELAVQDKIREKLIKNEEQWKNMLDVANIAANIAGGMSDAFNTLRDMADSFGFDTESNAWETAAAAMDTLTTVTGGVQKVVQSLMSGDIGGVISGAFDTLLSPFTIWNKLHDKKLDKMIERSQEAAQIMQNQYDILEKRMANFLGNAAAMDTGVLGGAYGKQRQLMQGQLAELEKQRQAEMDKKKSDDSVVEDYNQQIEEMKISIRDFAIEVANDLYGIDLNGWAEQLGDSLVEAFAAGEDAAEAFDKTVGDIMRDVTSKMISQDILAPMFGDLRNFLFGENGEKGAFGEDFKLDASEMASMKEYLDKIKDEGIPAAEELFNAINEATGGILNATDTATNSLSAGIQSVTEDTADLLASYLNEIRADVAMQTGSYWTRLLDDSLPQMNVIAQSQLDAQRQIAEYTHRNAIAAEAIVESTDEISRLLLRATQGGAKFYVQ